MNLNPIAILVVIAIGAVVFGGIVLFGLHSGTPPAVPGPVTMGTTVHVPDILNLPGFGSRQNQPSGNQSAGGGSGGLGQSGGASSPGVVVERNELPTPLLPAAPAPSQQPRSSGGVAPQSQARPVPAPLPQSTAALPSGLTPSPQATTSATLPSVPKQPTPSQAAAIASFSVFDASPQMRDFRSQMVKDGAIKSYEFARINNNSDMEAFLLKLVEWKGKQASSTPAQIQDARDRIIKAYGHLR